MTVFDAHPLSRRALLGAATTAGLAGMVGCSNAGRGGTSAGNNTVPASQVRPTFVPYKGVTPDLDGSQYGIPNAFTKYPEKLVKGISTPPGDGKPITTMTYTNSAIPTKESQNDWWQAINKAIGSEIQLNLTPSADYAQKFPAAVAGGNLPDIWQLGAITNTPQMLAAKALDLTPYLGGDNSKKYPFLAQLPTDGWNFGTFEGRLYGIPITRGAISTPILYARKDLFDKKGIPAEVKNADDLVNIAKEMTDTRNNIFAFAAAPTVFVQNMWGIANTWKIEGDALVSANEDPAQEDALNLLVQLWQAKYIHPDAFTGQNTDLKLRFNNGVCPMVVDTFSGFGGYQPNPNKQADIAFISPPGHDGSDIGKPWIGSPAISVTMVSKSAEDRIEVMLNYLNYLAAPLGTEEALLLFSGIEGVTFNMKGGFPVATDKGTAQAGMSLGYQAAPPFTIFYPVPGSNQTLFNGMKGIISNALANPVIGMYSDAANTKGAQINAKLTDVQNNIIQGRAKVSDWAPAVKAWKAGGGDKMAEELYAVYKSTR